MNFFSKKDNQNKKPKLIKARTLLLIFLITIFNEFLFLADHTNRISLEDLLAKVSPIELTQLTNSRREEADLETLTVDPRLIGAAKLKANHMAENGYFDHVSPDGVEPWHWFDEAGYEYQYAGENLAVNFSESEQIDKAWMNSPLHKKNIVNQNFEDVGIATSVGEYKGQEATFVVQLFGKKPSKYAQLMNEVEKYEDENQPDQGDQTELAQNNNDNETEEDVLGEETQNLPPRPDDQQKQQEEPQMGIMSMDEEESQKEVEETQQKIFEPAEESFALINKTEDDKKTLLTGNIEEVIQENNAKSEYVSFWSRATSSTRSLIGYLLALTFISIFGSLAIKKGINEDLRLPDVLVNETMVLLVIFSALLTQHYLLQIATTLL